MNPAKVIRAKLNEQPRGRTKGEFAALPYAEVPAFVQAPRVQPGNAARALEFSLLTASRTGETLTWALALHCGPGERKRGVAPVTAQW